MNRSHSRRTHPPGKSVPKGRFKLKKHVRESLARHGLDRSAATPAQRQTIKKFHTRKSRRYFKRVDSQEA